MGFLLLLPALVQGLSLQRCGVGPFFPLLRSGYRTPIPTAGLFDMFKESEAAKAAKDAAWKEQQAMLARRKNPAAMESYNEEVAQRRSEAAQSDAELKSLQLGQGGGDSLEQWQSLVKEGKAKSMDSTERDKGSERLGSAGLVADRMDEQLPYIDQGYVADDQPDFMAAMGKLFGGDKKKD